MKHRKTYWRGLDELHGDAEFDRLRQNEFAEDLPVGRLVEKADSSVVSRRDFLKLAGFATAAVTSACSHMPVKKAVPYLIKPEEIVPGDALWYATTCASCSSACAILAKCREGRPIKLEGNPDSPLNAGGLCAVGQAGILSLYDSGRLQGPLINGDPVTWNAVDSRVMAELTRLRSVGGAVRVLSPTIVSPATRAVIDGFLAGFSDARHVVYDAVSASALVETHARLYGVRAVPHYDFSKARLIVGIDTDFLGTWISPVEFSRQYANARRLTGAGGKMTRHIQFEQIMTLTGTNADTRVRVKDSAIPMTALRLLSAIRVRSGADPMPGLLKNYDAAFTRSIEKTADELIAERGRSIVVCGANERGAQLATARINEVLGNIGVTVDVAHPSYQKQGVDSDMSALVGEMKAGKIDALVVYGANPAYDWGASLEKALAKVPLVISLNRYRDETSLSAHIVCPDHHYLESFNDAEPASGLRHLTQAALPPVYRTRQAQESLLKWSDREPAPYGAGRGGSYADFLRAHWEENVYPFTGSTLPFELFWNQALHDGVVRFAPQNSFSPTGWNGDTAVFTATLGNGKTATADTTMTLSLYESIGMRDGAHANNPWLEELPDPVSKTTWGNFAAFSPADAKRLGITNGDVVQLNSLAKSLELPALVQPGQAEATVGVALGYGRTASGKVGDGVGGNAYPFIQLRDGLRRYSGMAVSVTTTGRKEALALTQTHHAMEGRELAREITLEEWRSGIRADPHATDHSTAMLWQSHVPIGSNWGLAIDLNACTGCSACVIGCQAENNVAVVGREEVIKRREMSWIRIDRYYEGDETAPAVMHQPVMCQHCANAPCESVCPVLATVHSSDGLNQQVYNRCVGTRYCANNCPYKVRRFNWFDYADNTAFDFHMNDPVGKLVLNPDIVVRTRGVMEKCSLCVQRIQEGKLKARLEGRELRDGDIKTACQQSCPADAIVFGDLHATEGKLVKLLKHNGRRYRLLSELNVSPNVNYLAKVRNR